MCYPRSGVARLFGAMTVAPRLAMRCCGRMLSCLRPGRTTPRASLPPTMRCCCRSHALTLTQADQDADDLTIPHQVSLAPGSPDLEYTFGTAELQNVRSRMEDRVVCWDLSSRLPTGPPRVVLLGVFDGHGGAAAAEYMQAAFVERYLELLPQHQHQLDTTLVATLKALDEELIAQGEQAGSTACVYLLAGDMGCTAHVGDSRAVLCSLAEAVALTADHKPGVNPSERKRLQDAGAVLTQDGYIELGGAEGEVADIMVSRALGGAHITCKHIILHEPELGHHSVHQGSEFVVVASDGVWDVLTNSEAVSTVRRELVAGNTPTQAAEALVQRAVAMGSADNISVGVLRLSSRPLPPPPTKYAHSALRRLKPAAAPAAAPAVAPASPHPVAEAPLPAPAACCPPGKAEEEAPRPASLPRCWSGGPEHTCSLPAPSTLTTSLSGRF